MYHHCNSARLHPPQPDCATHPAAGVFMPPPFSDQFLSIRKALAFLKSELESNDSSVLSSPSPPAYLHCPTTIQSPWLQEDVCHPLSVSCKEEESIPKVFSAGDLKQIINSLQNGRRLESPLGQENCGSNGVKKVGSYSAEERKERIKRYRSKRNQRNFCKKIKYACRKTLADSRPRVRGRFARSEEMEECSERWSQQTSGANIYEDDVDDAWTIFLDAFSMNVVP